MVGLWKYTVHPAPCTSLLQASCYTMQSGQRAAEGTYDYCKSVIQKKTEALGGPHKYAVLVQVYV